MPRYAFPSLTPTYSLGSGARTNASILIGSRNSKIGTQNRIYSYMAAHGQGQAYKQYLQQSLGPARNINLWSIIS